MILHHNTKVVKSKASLKTFEAKFGESVGLDMKLKVETECDVYDQKSMMDSWSNYHYNPLVATMFSFTETALTSSGQPTTRLHKYTLTHNPAQSSTKRAEEEGEVSAATRQENQQIKKIKLSSQQAENIEHQRKLETCLNKLNSKQGYAFSAQVNCKLTGSQTQDFSYSITAGAGNNNLEHKWNMDLHLQNQNQKVCMDGYMKYPTSYSSPSRFQYKNHVGFGQTCQQYHVDVVLLAGLSEPNMVLVLEPGRGAVAGGVLHVTIHADLLVLVLEVEVHVPLVLQVIVAGPGSDGVGEVLGLAAGQLAVDLSAEGVSLFAVELVKASLQLGGGGHLHLHLGPLGGGLGRVVGQSVLVEPGGGLTGGSEGGLCEGEPAGHQGVVVVVGPGVHHGLLVVHVALGLHLQLHVQTNTLTELGLEGLKTGLGLDDLGVVMENHGGHILEHEGLLSGERQCQSSGWRPGCWGSC